MSAQERAEVKRLRMWIARIININDEPAHFNKEIDDACMEALEGKPPHGKIDASIWGRVNAKSGG